MAVRPEWRDVWLDFRGGPGETRLLQRHLPAMRTHLHLEAWQVYFRDLPNQRLVSMGVHGATFQDDLPPQIVVCSNLHSLYE
eukprot:5146390-Pleurochrysis_carterae.AAC.1